MKFSKPVLFMATLVYICTSIHVHHYLDYKPDDFKKRIEDVCSQGKILRSVYLG